MKYFALVTRGSSPASGIAVRQGDIWSYPNHFTIWMPLKHPAAPFVAITTNLCKTEASVQYKKQKETRAVGQSGKS